MPGDGTRPFRRTELAIGALGFRAVAVVAGLRHREPRRPGTDVAVETHSIELLVVLR